MNFMKIISSSIFQILSVISVIGYLLGLLNIYFGDKNNYCVMTYMYEYPQYVRISVPENKIYPQYGLHAYSEGRYTEKSRKMWFDGIPVLFLPGNAGSHMQARSLASVALRKAISKGYEFHFDYFTISYNEELSGLYGGVLDSQTEFAAACINKILSLYKNNKYVKTVPTSVILIGHSMGGLVAKRLLAHPMTKEVANIAVTLASPLEAPVINVDLAMDAFYKYMDYEWNMLSNDNPLTDHKKVLISFGNGPRDILIPAGLTYSVDSYINALAPAIPGVWVSPDHVGIVWCKQLVMAINRFFFSIVDQTTNQITEDKQIIMKKAKQYFEANRTIMLSPEINRPNVTMQADAFWYEDNRRIYQISRPEINKTTYLMIRLASFPQNRFVAVEAVNTADKDWIFGCNAQLTYNTYRYCKQATSLTELSRWTGAATNFGRRKLATVHLHDIMDKHPDWTHVVFKVSPTRKPIVLNVDVNDHASRQIVVDLSSGFTFGKTIIKQETDLNAFYYELILPGFDKIYQAYFLYIEPTESCKANQYHVSAEVHVPWAKNNEYYHYFTHLKHTPMKLRLFKTNPNLTIGLDPTEHVKITVLLDPQCTFTMSISTSWYHLLGQYARAYTPFLGSYVVSIVLLAARSCLMHLNEHGTCISIHNSLMSEGVKPYNVLVLARLAIVVLMSLPALSFLYENASSNNQELLYFNKSLLVLPAFMIALGFVNIMAAAIIGVMVFSSQLAHRMLFRIVWRGGPGLAEKVASGLRKVPLLVSAALVCAAPLSCGAASLVVGAAFYAFMLSKMCEDYLEDYVYKLAAKAASWMCHLFKNRNKNTENKTDSEDVNVNAIEENKDLKAIDSEDVNVNAIEENKDLKAIESSKEVSTVENKDIISKKEEDDIANESESDGIKSLDKSEDKVVTSTENKCDAKVGNKKNNIDEDLNNLNFHAMMFSLWLTVTLVNIPALLTWARNFKYSMVLTPDMSYHTGLVMSVCSACIWQIDAPRKNLRLNDNIAAIMYTMAVFIIALGPTSVALLNYGVTVIFALITLQQLFDKDDTEDEENVSAQNSEEILSDKNDNFNDESEKVSDENVSSEQKISEKVSSENIDNEPEKSESVSNNEDCVCNENRIFNVFKRLRDKFDFTED